MKNKPFRLVAALSETNPIAISDKEMIEFINRQWVAPAVDNSYFKHFNVQLTEFYVRKKH